MADYYPVSEFVDIEFEGNVKLEMSYNTICGQVKAKELFSKVPELHQYFNAEQAIEFMHPNELEKLRSLIAPEIDRLNTEERERLNHLEQAQSKANIEHWQKLNTLKHTFQTQVKSKDDEIKRLKHNNSLLSEDLNMCKETLRKDRDFFNSQLGKLGL